MRWRSEASPAPAAPAGRGCCSASASAVSAARPAAPSWCGSAAANAEVLSVTDAQIDVKGTRTAKLTLRVSPVNESEYKTARTVAIPGGRVPNAGETVTVKFDPHSRKDFVLLEESFEVKDHVNASADAFLGGLQKSS